HPSEGSDCPLQGSRCPPRAEVVPCRATAIPRRATEIPKRADAVPRRAGAVPRRAKAVPRRAVVIPHRAKAAPLSRASAQARQHPLQPLHGPVDLLPLDDQGGSDADHMVVGLLAQEPLVLERLAEAAGAAGLAVQLDADPQPLAAHLLDVLRADLAQP